MSNEEVFELLTQKYTLVLASTPDEIEAVIQIRKDVFSKKLGLSSDILEKKGFLYGESDKQSFIYLLKENSTGNFIGTNRIFFVNELTPISVITKEIYSHVDNIESLTKGVSICEISRFALLQNIEPCGELSGLQLRGYLSMALMATIGINIFLYSCDHIFATMERSLHRIIRRQNIIFKEIGDPVEYYGERIPYMIKRNDLIANAKEIFESLVLYYLHKICSDPDKLYNFIEKNPYLDYSHMQIDRLSYLFKKYGKDIRVSDLLSQ